MFPSSDTAIPNTLRGEDRLASSNNTPTAKTMLYEPRTRDVPASSVDMTGTEQYADTAQPSSRMVDERYAATPDHTFSIHDDYTPVRSPQRTSKVDSYKQLSPHARPSHTQSTISEGRGSHHSTPDPYTAVETYHGASDIDVRKSISSSTDAELFSDIEEDEEDDLSGFEANEVADLQPEASGALGSGDEALDFRSDIDKHQHDEYSEDEEDEAYNAARRSHAEKLRAISYESYPNSANSPTESQLRDEGFEFHNEQHHEQIGKFSTEAFRELLKDVSPDLPRKQQWYAWRKVMELLDNEAGNDDLFDDSDLPNDFSLGSLAEHTFGGCQCAGNGSRCSCAQGQCGCAGCPRHSRSSGQQEGMRAADEEEQHDVPMVIGHTPITPLFGQRLNQKVDFNNLHGADDPIPGLGMHLEPLESQEESRDKAFGKMVPSKANCGCSCGDDCQCPRGQCRCSPRSNREEPAVKPATTVTELFQDPLKRPAAFHDPQETWSDAATIGQSPSADLREPPTTDPHFPQIATQLSHSTLFSPNDAPTPGQGMRSPESYATTPATPMSQPISRPDTPRPQGDTYEFGIRQSVEPELLSPSSHRQSTPAYTNRSLSPSPISQQTPSDTSMHDATPTQLPRQASFTREGSVLPDAPPVPEAEPLSPPGSPYSHVPPVPAIPSHHQSSVPQQYAHIPAPPIPVSPTLKPRKQRATSTSNGGNAKRNTKSAVHGSKISKAQPKPRNVTRKATGKKVKQAVDRIEDSVRQAEEAEEEEKQRVTSRGSVKSWAMDDVLQKDGSPPRRSARVRQRESSPLG